LNFFRFFLATYIVQGLFAKISHKHRFLAPFGEVLISLFHYLGVSFIESLINEDRKLF